MSAIKLILHRVANCPKAITMNPFSQRSCRILPQFTIKSDSQIRKLSERPVSCLMEQMVHSLSNGLPFWLMGAKFPRIAYSSTRFIQPTVQSATAFVWLLCSLTQGRQISSIWRREKKRAAQTMGQELEGSAEEVFLISLNGSWEHNSFKNSPFQPRCIYPEPHKSSPLTRFQ